MIAIMLQDLFSALESRPFAFRKFAAGNPLFHRGDEVSSVLLLDSGSVKLSRSLDSGQHLTLHNCHAPGIVAEASVYSATYHCDAMCLTPCSVRVVPIAVFMALFEQDAQLAQCWSAYLARSLQAARLRSEILTIKRVTARLDAWLEWNDGHLPPKGRWREVAAEIGVSAEALYREIAARRHG